MWFTLTVAPTTVPTGQISCPKAVSKAVIWSAKASATVRPLLSWASCTNRPSGFDERTTMNAAVLCRAARNGYRPVEPATKSKPKSLRCSGGSAWVGRYARSVEVMIVDDKKAQH